MLERLKKLFYESKEDKIAESVKKWLELAGFDVSIKYSWSSNSVYVIVKLDYEEGDKESEELYDKYDGEYKIRISDHVLPPSYGVHFGDADYEIGNHMEAYTSDYFKALEDIFKSLKVKPPSRFYRVLKAKETRKKKEEEKQKEWKKIIDLLRQDEDRMEQELVTAIKKDYRDGNLSKEEYRVVISKTGQLKFTPEKESLYRKYNIKSNPDLKDIYGKVKWYRFIEGV